MLTAARATVGSEAVDTDDEQQRLDILEHYVGGRIRDPSHSAFYIRQLLNLGYLRIGITPQIEETMKTTSKGLVYLKMSGYDVDAPEIVDGRMVRQRPSESV